MEIKNGIKKIGISSLIGSMPLSVMLIWNTLQGIENQTAKMSASMISINIKLEKIITTVQYQQKEINSLDYRLEKVNNRVNTFLVHPAKVLGKK